MSASTSLGYFTMDFMLLSSFLIAAWTMSFVAYVVWSAMLILETEMKKIAVA